MFLSTIRFWPTVGKNVTVGNRGEGRAALRLAALRDAAKLGTADIKASNFGSFDSADRLAQHLAALTAEVIDR